MRTQDETGIAMGDGAAMDLKQCPTGQLIEVLNPTPPEPPDPREEHIKHLTHKVNLMATKLAAVSELTVRQQAEIDELKGRSHGHAGSPSAGD